MNVNPANMHLKTNPRGARLKTGNDRSALMSRLRELELAMKQPGGARVTEERELEAVRGSLLAAEHLAVEDTARATRCSLADFNLLNTHTGMRDRVTDAKGPTNRSA
jgi:hypothetical protein